MHFFINQYILNLFIKYSIHWGHHISESSPNMAKYLLFLKDEHTILDIVKASKLLKLAGDCVEDISKKGKTILYIGTSSFSKIILEYYFRKTIAKTNGAHYINYLNYRWIDGIFTNFHIFRIYFKKLRKYVIKHRKSIFRSKKRRLRLLKIIRTYRGILFLKKVPGLIICIDQLANKKSLMECKKASIPSISIVDSDGDPNLATYPIISNDDSLRSLNFILSYLFKRTNYNNYSTF